MAAPMTRQYGHGNARDFAFPERRGRLAPYRAGKCVPRVGKNVQVVEAAAADDGRADGGHQNQRPEGASAEIIIIHAPDLFDHHKADEHHCDEICADDRQIQRMNFVVNHVCLLSFRQADTCRIM